MNGKLTVENTTRLRLRYDNQLEKRIFLENQSESRVTVLTVTATVVTATVCTVTTRQPIRKEENFLQPIKGQNSVKIQLWTR